MSALPADRQAVPRQLPLDLAAGSASGRDDFVPGRSNAAAIALVDRWPDWPARVVVVAGPAGAGKSHLAAIWREASGATPIAPGALGTRGVEQAALTPVLVEDIDRAPLDQPGLFHLINAVASAGTHLLLTGRSFPLAWGATLPDLVSRLRAATVVELLEPDDALLSAVIVKLFADRQVDVDPAVVQFMVRRIERSVASAIEAVGRLDRAALEAKSRITRPLAARVLDEMEQGEVDLPFA